MRSPCRVLWLALLVPLAGGCLSAEEFGQGGTPPFRAGTTRYRQPLRSWTELRDEHVVRQGADYSCGAASLATLMRYYFKDKVSERDVLASILDALSDAELQDRQKNGLSLLDLKLCAERMGYQAAGVRLQYSALPKLKGPILLHVNPWGNNHFVVFRGVEGDRICLADPSWGNVRMPVDEFAKQWTGVGLILGKEGFGLPEDYPLALGAAERVENEDLLARRALYVTPSPAPVPR